jgi:hypothetical protein
MPYYTYQIETAQGLVISTACERVTYAEIRDHQDRLLLDLNFDPKFGQLIDGSRTIALDISSEEARLIASRRIFPWRGTVDGRVPGYRNDFFANAGLLRLSFCLRLASVGWRSALESAVAARVIEVQLL